MPDDVNPQQALLVLENAFNKRYEDLEKHTAERIAALGPQKRKCRLCGDDFKSTHDECSKQPAREHQCDEEHLIWDQLKGWTPSGRREFATQWKFQCGLCKRQNQACDVEHDCVDGKKVVLTLCLVTDKIHGMPLLRIRPMEKKDYDQMLAREEAKETNHDQEKAQAEENKLKAAEEDLKEELGQEFDKLTASAKRKLITDRAKSVRLPRKKVGRKRTRTASA